MKKGKLLIALLLTFSMGLSSVTTTSYADEASVNSQVNDIDLSQKAFSLAADQLVDNLEVDEAPIDPRFYNQGSGEKDQYNGVNVDPFNIYTDYNAIDNPKFERQMSTYLPRSFDLRDQGRVTAVRDQGPNGSCWAFATYGSAESVLLPNEVTDFSEKHLRNTHGFDWGPKDGGSYRLSSAYLARWSGPIDERDDPYDPYIFYSPSNLTPLKELESAIFVPNVRNANDTATLKQEIMNNGAAYTTVYGDESYTNFQTMGHYNHGRGRGDHAVTLVGWDDNYSRNNFKGGAPGDGAWLAKNSWGSNWGSMGGYYYISYYDSVIGTGNCIFKLKDRERDKSVWYHDPLGMTNAIGNGTTGWFANVFGPTKENLQIGEVGVFVPTNDVDYEVYVNTNIGGNSGFNDRVKVAQGNIKYAGYTTIKFDPQQIPKGAYFAPIIKFTSTGYRYNIPVEMPINGYSSRARASMGQSFVSHDGSNWADLTNEIRDTNVCLKAFTKPSDSKEIIDDKDNTNKKVEKINIKAESSDLELGDSQKLNIEVLPADASNKELKFTSSNNNIASVDSNGVVKGLSSGRATITARATDGSGVYGYIDINVIENKEQPIANKISVDLKSKKAEYKEDEKVELDIQTKNGSNVLPYANVKILITTLDGRVHENSGKTDSRGFATYTYYPDRNAKEGKYQAKVIVYYGNEESEASTNFSIVKKSVDSLKLDFTPDKNTYYYGDKAAITLKLKNSDGSLVRGYPLDIRATGPNNFNYPLEKVTDSNGSAVVYIQPDRNMGPGLYKIEVKSKNSSDKLNESYEVNFLDPNKKSMSIELLDLKDSYKTSNRISIPVIIKDEKGSNLSNASVKFTVENQEGRVIAEKMFLTSYQGKATFQASFLKQGEYTIKIQANRSDYAQVTKVIKIKAE